MLTTKEERTWALAAHIAAPVGMLLSAGLLGFLIPLVVWIAKREESEFVADQAKEALNFQLTILGIWIAGAIFVLVTLGLGLLLVIPAFLLVWLLQLVLGIVAALRAYEGVRYRYPFALRLVT